MNDNIQALKEQLAKVRPLFQQNLPMDNSPNTIKQLKMAASHASATALDLAIYKRALDSDVKQREAEIVLENIDELRTPKEMMMKALVNRELGEAKSYLAEVNTLIDICSQRVILIMAHLKSIERDGYLPGVG